MGCVRLFLYPKRSHFDSILRELIWHTQLWIQYFMFTLILSTNSCHVRAHHCTTLSCPFPQILLSPSLYVSVARISLRFFLWRLLLRWFGIHFDFFRLDDFCILRTGCAMMMSTIHCHLASFHSMQDCFVGLSHRHGSVLAMNECVGFIVKSLQLFSRKSVGVLTKKIV